MPQSPSGRTERKDYLDFTMPFWTPASMGHWNPMRSGMQAWNGTCSKAVATLNSEWLDFFNRRVKVDLALPQQLASCKSPDEIWRVYAEFCQKAVDDYQKEFAEVARLGNSVASECAGAMQQGTANGSSDSSARTSRY